MKKGILETIVPAYPNMGESRQHKPVKLGAWFTSSRYADQVRAIRSLPDGKARTAMIESLPCIRPQWAYMENGKVAMSGLICLEILRYDNPGLILDAAKQHLSKIANVALVAVNAAADGLLVFIPANIRTADDYYGHFITLASAFDLIGYNADRLGMFLDTKYPITYDDAVYVNDKATPFSGKVEVNTENLIKKTGLPAPAIVLGQFET